ncbi:hypothetical protein TNCV_4021261 [Trichonephila clavipes]|nr:hypothetical protein TNCV_4021261 [Trichonephila clavipes]
MTALRPQISMFLAPNCQIASSKIRIKVKGFPFLTLGCLKYSRPVPSPAFSTPFENESIFRILSIVCLMVLISQRLMVQGRQDRKPHQ